MATLAEEELLAREGRALGLDQNDTIVRRRLAQKVGFMVADTARIADPDESELRGFYTAHAERYQLPPGSRSARSTSAADRRRRCRGGCERGAATRRGGCQYTNAGRRRPAAARQLLHRSRPEGRRKPVRRRFRERDLRAAAGILARSGQVRLRGASGQRQRRAPSGTDTIRGGPPNGYGGVAPRTRHHHAERIISPSCARNTASSSTTRARKVIGRRADRAGGAMNRTVADSGRWPGG